MTSSPDVATDSLASSTVNVALVVLGADPRQVATVLDATAAEGADRSFVVGGGSATRRAAEESGATWVAKLGDITAQLGSDITHVWVLHADSRPRRGALRALVSEAERLDASVAGSKVLRASDPTVLESVGGATDVFGHPYSGLVDGEVDQEQYDVIRDVAFVPGVSVLIRRDLFLGLGGPDLLLAPVAQGVDLAQRARLLGGRVVVVPSSEVFHDGSCATAIPQWRERAGEIRAAVKAYSPVTLVWVLPVLLAVGMVSALARLVMGRPGPIVDEAKAWMWNAKNLRSTLAGRRSTARSRRVGDEELFRYQARGSVVLREVGDELSDWVRERSRAETGLGAFLSERRDFWQQPGFIAGVAAVVVAVVATRSLWWDGMPVTGYALAAHGDWRAVLANYAGGWNPSGFGTSEPLRPAVALLTSAAALGIGAPALTMAAVLSGFLGTMRLLRLWGAPPAGRIAGAFAAAFGPAMMAAGASGYWPAMIAAGLVPWAAALALAPLPETRRARVGRIGSLVLAIGLATMLVPWASIVPAGVALAFATHRRSWRPVVMAVGGAVAGLAFALPWIAWVPLQRLLTSGAPVYFDLQSWVMVVLAALAVAAVFVGDRDAAGLTAAGVAVTAAGLLVGRSAFISSGLEGSAGALVATMVGLPMVVGGVASASAVPVRESDGGRRAMSWIGRGLLLAVVGALVVSVVPALGAGRLGLEADRYGEALAFTGPRSGPQGPDRILFLGAGAPGESRTIAGVPYRVMSASAPLTEAWLGGRGAADVALEETLYRLRDPQAQRPGAALASFGIKWVIVTEPNLFEDGFQAKLDMRKLALFDVPFVVYENLESSPRAVRSDGVIWRHDGFGYHGVANQELTVRLAEHFTPRWEPDAEAEEWATVVSAGDGSAHVAVDGRLRALALASGLMAAAAAAAAVAGIGGRR